MRRTPLMCVAALAAGSLSTSVCTGQVSDRVAAVPQDTQAEITAPLDAPPVRETAEE